MSERWTNLKNLEHYLDVLKKNTLPKTLSKDYSYALKSFKLSSEGIKRAHQRTYVASMEIGSYLFDFTVDVWASFPKSIPVLTMVSESNASGEINEESNSPASGSAFRLPLKMQEMMTFVNKGNESLAEPDRILFWQLNQLAASLEEYAKLKEDIGEKESGSDTENENVEDVQQDAQEEQTMELDS